KKYGKDADFFSIYDYGRIHSAFNNYNDNTLSLILSNHKSIAMMSYEEACKTLSLGMENIIKPFINTPKKLNIFLDIFATAAKVENQIDIASGIGINSKSRVNRRNAAMSKVAEILGCSDVIAKSENIRITLNGNPVKGTFMKEATGEDLNKIDTNSVMFGLNSYSANSFNAKKQLASLQILDYICGNPDRHAGNMLYTFDKDSKGNTYLKSIQGIDNDSCFGRNPFEDVGMASVLPSDMMVIPVDICNRLMNLEPEVLKNVLYGFDLTSREVNAALKRLDTLKTKIMDDQKKYSQGYTKGYLIPDTIKVVEDKELDELILNTDLYKLRKHKRAANLFTRIKNNISGSTAVEDFLNLKAKAYENACYDVTVGNIGKVSDLIIRLDKDERLGASSPEYRAMLRALRELNEALVEFNGPVRGKGTDTSKGHVQKINEIKERYRQTLITVNEYIGYKDSKKKGEEWRLIKGKHTPSRTERRYMNALECRNFLNEQLDKIVELDIPLNEYNKARKKNKSLMNNVMLNENRYTATEELLKTFDTHANNLYNNHMSRTRYVVAQAFKDYTKCKPAFKDYYKVMLDMLIGYGLNGTKDNDRKAFRDYVEQITNIKLEGDDDAIIKRAYAS
ncbi:MAG: hypothetical protein II699_00185, partial [Lachnospiraceae bacterium]|nr:hypothetical protein [Lachnospiraceae bacterium]